MKQNVYPELLIDRNSKIFHALQQMDDVGRKLLIVIDESSYYGLLSIGDIQRAIIKGVSLDKSIHNILRNDVVVAREGEDLEQIKKYIHKERTEYMPIVSSSGKIVNVLFWEDLFDTSKKPGKRKLEIPVLIMAGGMGSRLKPLTNVLPKALIPIGEKSIIEQIMDSFKEYGCDHYYISINHKAELIRYYFANLETYYGKIEYIQESEFWGTAGSIGLAKDIISQTFFVSNCDILVDQDYADILDYHLLNKNEITVVAAILNIKVPYGVLNTNSDGFLQSITEKPELYYKINTGLYVCEPSVLPNIPPNQVFHITELIEGLLNQGRKVGVFPISEQSWTDMGNWDEFLKQAKIK